MPPRLEVYNTLTKTTEKGPYVISAQYGDFDVSEEMRRILTEEQGKKTPHTHTHTFMGLHKLLLKIIKILGECTFTPHPDALRLHACMLEEKEPSL
jgi:hypothetical protein